MMCGGCARDCVRFLPISTVLFCFSVSSVRRLKRQEQQQAPEEEEWATQDAIEETKEKRRAKAKEARDAKKMK
jgi:hypothetical protein